nr:hypothetical protein Iba_chr01cCG10970 [Ipomoea batatas]
MEGGAAIFHVSVTGVAAHLFHVRLSFEEDLAHVLVGVAVGESVEAGGFYDRVGGGRERVDLGGAFAGLVFPGLDSHHDSDHRGGEETGGENGKEDFLLCLGTGSRVAETRHCIYSGEELFVLPELRELKVDFRSRGGEVYISDD